LPAHVAIGEGVWQMAHKSVLKHQQWSAGYGPIHHTDETIQRVELLASRLSGQDRPGDGVHFREILYALDRLCCAGMWLVVHQTYARNVYLDGRPLQREDFKPRPEGHTGGSLNMVPAYAGYLAANVVSGFTRGWLMGQGHCVSAIDSLNLLVGNMNPAHSQRYSLTDEGLTRYVRDYYSYKLGPHGQPESPLGSHVNEHTAGGISEGGYLGFAELQYVHMPLPGERLVVFLSDGAFEEQRGSDWAPRWWRAEDSGLVAPIMIKNGRRIDQRTTMSQQGGAEWFCDHLRLNGFDPIVFDGRDPAAFLWAIIEIESRLEFAAEEVRQGKRKYPVPLPYGIALAPKGAGFPGEGTNLAHNLPLLSNPFSDPPAAAIFNEGVRNLWVSRPELHEAISKLTHHSESKRVRERDNPFVHRVATVAAFPPLPARPVDEPGRITEELWTFASPMSAVDEVFASIVGANPHLRPRVGNPDEMRSNRLIRTLDTLKFRVTDPEAGIPESIHGAVITALNEEAVVSAALANKAGINLAHTYEAFGTKMHGAVRQEIIFARNCALSGRPQEWLSVPIIMTSHTWENGKNEHSHQDPSFAETMMGEPMPFSRVLFPADFNTAAAVTDALYRTQGQIWTLVVPKSDAVPNLFTPAEAAQLIDHGGFRLDWATYRPEDAKVVLAASGAYQLIETLRAAKRLREKNVPHIAVYWLEPGRLHENCSGTQYAISDRVYEMLQPLGVPTVFCTHTRPHIIWGLVGPRIRDGAKLRVLGYQNQGGTLNTPGMLFVNRSTWAHCVLETAQLLQISPEELLNDAEIAALTGKRQPQGVIIPHPQTEQ
jgi:phosphoketolase